MKIFVHYISTTFVNVNQINIRNVREALRQIQEEEKSEESTASCSESELEELRVRNAQLFDTLTNNKKTEFKTLLLPTSVQMNVMKTCNLFALKMIKLKCQYYPNCSCSFEESEEETIEETTIDYSQLPRDLFPYLEHVTLQDLINYGISTRLTLNLHVDANPCPY